MLLLYPVELQARRRRPRALHAGRSAPRAYHGGVSRRMRLRTSAPGSSRPPVQEATARPGRRKPRPCAPELAHELARRPRAVPPVAITSSTTSTRSPAPSASSWISRRVRPVLERVGARASRGRQLARLAHGHEARCRADRRATPPRMKPRLSIATTLSGRSSPQQRREEVQAAPERDRVLQQRRDVLEDDARLREIGHVADRLRAAMRERGPPAAHGRSSDVEALLAARAGRRRARRRRPPRTPGPRAGAPRTSRARSSGASATTSTVPSGRLRAKPATPRDSASRSTK